MESSGSNVIQSAETQVEATESQLLLEKRYIGRLPKGVPTVDVANVEHWVAINTAAQNITYFRNGQPGQHLYILGDGFTTIVHTPGVIENFGAANKLLADGKVAHYLMYDDGVWYEESSEGAQGPPGPSLPEAANATERDTLYPSPSVGFKVLMLDSDTLQRWNGTIWETTLAGEEGPPGPAGALRGVVYAADTLDKTGAADIAVGMDTIIAAAGSNFVEILFERGTYRIATERSWGRKVKLTFQPGAELLVDGVNVYFTGLIEAGLHAIFRRINGGNIYLHANLVNTWNDGGALNLEYFTEWFGAMGDNTAIDDEGFDFLQEAIRGLPKTPQNIPSWVRGALRLRAGGVYKKEKIFRPAEAGIGFSVSGGGIENCEIRYNGGRDTFTIASFVLESPGVVTQMRDDNVDTFYEKLRSADWFGQPSLLGATVRKLDGTLVGRIEGTNTIEVSPGVFEVELTLGLPQSTVDLTGQTLHLTRDKLNLTGTIPTDSVGDRWLVAGGPTDWGKAREVTAVSGQQITTAGNHELSFTGQNIYLLHLAVIDISGGFDFTFSDFTIKVQDANNARVMSGIYYHKDAGRTLRGSSCGNFLHVGVQGRNYHVAGFAIGSYDPSNLLWQEDLATFVNCKARAGHWWDYDEDSKKIWAQVGFRFGSGLFANPLNYTCEGCVSTGWKYGTWQGGTNLFWKGGTVQSNYCNHYLFNGAQSYATYIGYRSESSGMLLDSFSGQSASFHIHLEDIEFQGNDLIEHPEFPGEYVWARFAWTGGIKLKGLRFLNPSRQWNQNPDQATIDSGVNAYTAIGVDGNGNGYVELSTGTFTPGEWDNSTLIMFDPDVGSLDDGMEFVIKENTATRITIDGPWVTTATRRAPAPGESGKDWTVFPPNGRRYFSLLKPGKLKFAGDTKLIDLEMIDVQMPFVRQSQVLDINKGVKAAFEFDIGGLHPIRRNSTPSLYGRVHKITKGVTVELLHDFNTSSDSFPVRWWTRFSGRIKLTADYEIPLGGSPTGDIDAPTGEYVPFPEPGAVVKVLVQQDGTGGRNLTFNCIKPIRWVNGVVPSTSWAANRWRKYEFYYTGDEYLAELKGEYS